MWRLCVLFLRKMYPMFFRDPKKFLAAAVTTIGLAVLPVPAWAHDTLVSSNPSDGAQLQQAPEQVEMTFSAEILDVGTQVRVTDTQGADATEGDVRVEGTTVSQAVKAPENKGESYTVTWRVVSSDGHPIEGTFSYDVGDAPSRGGTQNPTAATKAHSTASPSAAEQEKADDDANKTPLAFYAGGGIAVAMGVLGVLVIVHKFGRKRS